LEAAADWGVGRDAERLGRRGRGEADAHVSYAPVCVPGSENAPPFLMEHLLLSGLSLFKLLRKSR
jgi:hypothetical protein